MDGADWLDDIAQRVAEQISEVEISRSYAYTLALSRGLRSVVIHLDREQAWLRHRSPLARRSEAGYKNAFSI